MIRYRTLGVLDLRAGDGVELKSVLRQSKRLAVLAYLALASPGAFHRRDRLLAIFWPEAERDRARHALSQAIHYLRRALGPGVIVGRSDEEVGISPGSLWCDAVAFRDALAADQLEEALALYGGDLLPGLFVSDAPEFERWLEEERGALAKQAAIAAWTVAERSGAAGDPAAAAGWARRAVALAPWDEAGLRRLIALLDRLGDRAGAIEAYQDFVRRLQAEFEVEPSAETRELIESVKQRDEVGVVPPPAAIFGTGSGEATAPRQDAVQSEPRQPEVLPTAGQPDALEPLPTEAASGAAHPPAGPRHPPSTEPAAVNGWLPHRIRRIPRWALATAALAAVAVLASIPFLTRPDTDPPVASRTDRVAVLYFHDQVGGGENEFLPDALTTELIRQLHHEGKIEVISAQGVRQFRGRDAPVDSIANALDVSLIVGGTVTQSGDQLQVYVELTDAANGRVIDRTVVQRPASALFGLIEDVSREVGGFLRPILGREIRLSQWRAGTSDQRAWQLMKEADGLRLSAVDLTRRGEFNGAWNMVGRADSAAAQASALDRGWSEPLVLRGWLADARTWLCVFSGRAEDIATWIDSAQEFADRAIHLDPHDAEAFELRGTALTRNWLLATPPGKHADSLLAAAESDLASALNLDPALPRANSTMSAVLISQGRFAEARAAALRAYEADAFLTDVNELVIRLFMTSFELHDDDEASRWCDEIRRRMPDRWPYAYCALVLLGWGDAAPQDSLARAARLIHATFGRNEPASVRQAAHARLSMLLAGSYIRAGLPDSARAVILRNRYAPGADLDLMEHEAAAYVAIGQHDSALAVLARFFDVRPTARQRIFASRFFEPIRKNLASGDSR
jgi:serine/threonine-protein kinase